MPRDSCQGREKAFVLNKPQLRSAHHHSFSTPRECIKQYTPRSPRDYRHSLGLMLTSIKLFSTGLRRRGAVEQASTLSSDWINISVFLRENLFHLMRSLAHTLKTDPATGRHHLKQMLGFHCLNFKWVSHLLSHD
jgi:hypothetical protein